MKECKMCFKEIDKRAKKCPYCQHWQSKFQSFTRNPAFSIIIVICIMVFSSWFFNSQFTPKNNFDTYKNQVEITKSNIDFGNSSCGETVTIIGNIKNNSAIDWKSLNFEVVYYDKENNITDTEQIEKFSFTLPANKEVPFKLSMKKEFGDAQYVGYETRVISAREKVLFFE